MTQAWSVISQDYCSSGPQPALRFQPNTQASPRQVPGFAPSLFSPKPHRPPKSHMNLNDGHDDVLGHQVHCSSKGNQLPLVGLHLHPNHITSTAGSYVVRWQASGISLHPSGLRSGPVGLCHTPPHSWLTKDPRWSTQKRRTAAQISKTKKKKPLHLAQLQKTVQIIEEELMLLSRMKEEMMSCAAEERNDLIQTFVCWQHIDQQTDWLDGTNQQTYSHKVLEQRNKIKKF